MSPLLIALLVFVFVPLVELYFLIEVGSEIGAIPTIFLSVFTAVLGGLMVRVQGFTTARRVSEALQRDELPAVEMMEGVILLFAGVLLLLPGFVTDVVGFACLVPRVRRLLIVWFLRHSNGLRTVQARHPKEHPASPRVIEGEYRRED